MTLLGHDSNKSPSSNLFKNDTSSVSEARKRAKCLAEAAAAEKSVKDEAARREQARSDKEAADVREIQRLKALEAQLRQAVNTLNQEKAGLEKEKTALVTSEKNQRDMISALEGKVSGLVRDKQQLEQEKQQLEQEKSRQESLKPDPKNDLDISYDNKTVYIVNPYSNTSLDMGKDNGARVHGWNFGRDNSNQQMLLERADRSNPNSPWIIKCRQSGKYLEFFQEGSNTYARTGWHDRNNQYQQWYIGSVGQGLWAIRNVAINAAVDLSRVSPKFEDGVTIAGYSPRADDECKRWALWRCNF